MNIHIPRSYFPSGASKSGLAGSLRRPILAGIAGVVAPWAVYSLIRLGHARLSRLASGWREFARRRMAFPPRVPESLLRTDPAPEAPPPGAEIPVGRKAAEPPRVPAARDWIHAVREAMEKEPRDFGFAKTDWNAPLLGRYLESHHGQSIPVARIREALKESGYEWRVTRYRKAKG